MADKQLGRTHHLGEDLYIKPVMCASNERLWLLFDEGISHPLVVLSDYQVKELIKAFGKETNV